MILLQLVSLIFGLFMIYLARIHRIKQHISRPEFLVWMAFWIFFIFLVIFPQSTSGIAQTLRIARVFDLLVIIALMVVMYLTFNNRIENKKLDKKLEKIVRKNAIDDKK